MGLVAEGDDFLEDGDGNEVFVVDSGDFFPVHHLLQPHIEVRADHLSKILKNI